MAIQIKRIKSGTGFSYAATEDRGARTLVDQQLGFERVSGNLKIGDFGNSKGNVVDAVYSIQGNAGTADKLKTPRALGVALDRTITSTFDGSAAQTNIPVSGQLRVVNGGTGLDTLTAGSALVGNGTDAVTLREIVNQGVATTLTSNASLITAQTLVNKLPRINDKLPTSSAYKSDDGFGIYVPTSKGQTGEFVMTGPAGYPVWTPLEIPTPSDRTASTPFSNDAAAGTRILSERAIYHGTPTINNTKFYGSDYRIYAPITGGIDENYSRVVVGYGPLTTAPTWAQANSSNLILASNYIAGNTSSANAPSFKSLDTLMGGLSSLGAAVRTGANTYEIRPILNNTTATAVAQSTDLVTANTVYHTLPKINSSKTYTSTSDFYVPTAAGSTRQILVSAGSGAPVWSSATVSAAGQVTAASFNATSDRRVKENIKILELATANKLLSVPVKTFNYIKSEEKPGDFVGLIAQDLQEVLGEEARYLVDEDKETGYLSIRESKLIYMLLSIVQEQSNAIKSLESRLLELEVK